MNDATVASNRSPLSVVLDVLVAPKAAFESIDRRPRWLVAYLVVCVLGMIGAVLQIPAGEHVARATIDAQALHDPNLASLSPAKLEKTKQFASIAQRFVWVFYPLITIVGTALAALLMLVGNAIGRGSGSFAKFFALAVNIAIVNFGIFYLLVGLLTYMRPPDSFSTQSEMLKVIPSLAWLVPAGPKLTVVLESINPFTIWSFLLLALGFKTIAKVSSPVAYIVGFVIAYASLLIAVPFAK